VRSRTRSRPRSSSSYEALKKLRKVAAKLNAEEHNQVLHLWRGLKNTTFDLADMKNHDGTDRQTKDSRFTFWYVGGKR
jgi:hypothetical protein